MSVVVAGTESCAESPATARHKMRRPKAARMVSCADYPLGMFAMQEMRSIFVRRHHPSWPGGVAAAKPQTGWLFKFLKRDLQVGRGEVVLTNALPATTWRRAL